MKDIFVILGRGIGTLCPQKKKRKEKKEYIIIYLIRDHLCYQGH
jgi:hypothetical protein